MNSEISARYVTSESATIIAPVQDPLPAEGSLLEVSKTHQHTRLRASDPALILREQDEAFFLPAPFFSEYALILRERNTQKTREDTCLP